MQTRQGENLQPGNHTFVVMPNRSVRSFHEDVFETLPGAGHTGMTRKRPVIMAGTFDVDDAGSITRFDNFSGHYKPQYDPQNTGLEDITRDAFSRHGFDLGNARWDPFTYND
jgi:hypothetical protein